MPWILTTLTQKKSTAFLHVMWNGTLKNMVEIEVGLWAYWILKPYILFFPV